MTFKSKLNLEKELALSEQSKREGRSKTACKIANYLSNKPALGNIIEDIAFSTLVIGGSAVVFAIPYAGVSSIESLIQHSSYVDTLKEFASPAKMLVEIPYVSWTATLLLNYFKDKYF
jgi:hypothetical protein